MDTRPSKAYTFLFIARILSHQSTCSRRKVGAVLTNKYGHIIGSGYNGVAFGLPHCIDNNCSGADLKSGEGLSECEAIHAEQNALMQCSDIHSIDSVYCTTSPCGHCIKMLMNTSAKHIYFLYEYPNSDKCRLIWLSSDSDRTWRKLDDR